jgi:nucleotide-binding universal stress UspA family protein
VEAQTKKLLESSKIKASVVVEKGAVALTVLKHAVGRVGLVVLGHRGLDALDRFFLGSVSTQVSLHAPCSVLVVKQAPRAIRRVLLAVDGSQASDRSLQFLLQEMQPAQGLKGVKGAKGERIEVIVLHVIPPFAYAQVAVTGIALTHRYAKKLAAAGYRVKEAFKPGNPADEIVKAAKSRRADLVVAGAKGLGAVGRFLLGSVSSRLVRHSPCSILVVR